MRAHTYTYKEEEEPIVEGACYSFVCITEPLQWRDSVGGSGKTGEGMAAAFKLCKIYSMRNINTKVHAPFRKDSACAQGIRGAQPWATEDKDPLNRDCKDGESGQAVPFSQSVST